MDLLKARHRPFVSIYKPPIPTEKLTNRVAHSQICAETPRKLTVSERTEGVSAEANFWGSSADKNLIASSFSACAQSLLNVASEKFVLRRPMMTHHYQEWSVPTFNCPTLSNKGHN
jgi:hypothetical protein